MKILIDTNVLLDVGLQRAEFLPASLSVLQWCAARPDQAFVAWHSLSNVYYVLRKQRSEEAAREFLNIVLEIFEVPPAGTAFAKAAARFAMSDFEDALQVAAALAAGTDAIITRDREGFDGLVIPAQTPAEFLASVPR